MSSTLLMAAAGMSTVFGASDLIGALQRAASVGSVAAFVRPLRMALGAGRTPSDAERRRLIVLLSGCLGATGSLVSGWVLGVLLCALAPLVVAMTIKNARRRWQRDLGRGAAAAARAIADALAGGATTAGAVRQVASSGIVGGAAGRELSRAASAFELGADSEAAVASIAGRAGDPTWNCVVAAIAMQRRTGGDLAALLRHVADAADEQTEVGADARTVTAQARFTAKLVAGMPLAGVALTELVLPGTVGGILRKPLPLALSVLALVLIACSMFAIGRLARVTT